MFPNKYVEFSLKNSKEHEHSYVAMFDESIQHVHAIRFIEA